MDIASIDLQELSAVPGAFYLAIAMLAAWGGLLVLRGDFLRADQRLIEGENQPDRHPAVAVVVPARNEADVIGEAVSSIAGQEYPGDIRIFVVDDRSEDATAEIVQQIQGVTVVAGSEAPAGWTGKMWAVSQGVEAADGAAPDAEYIWLTDADIAHHPGELASLVAYSDDRNLDLNSLMVRLRVDGLWDVLLIPAFVFFFQKLYPQLM